MKNLSGRIILRALIVGAIFALFVALAHWSMGKVFSFFTFTWNLFGIGMFIGLQQLYLIHKAKKDKAT